MTRKKINSSLAPTPAAVETMLAEMDLLRMSKDQEFFEQLERDATELERHHRAALEAAAKEHEQVRQSAEVARQRFEHEIQKELQRRQDEEARALEHIRQEKLERELAQRRAEIERLQREEGTRRRIEQEARAHADAAQRTQQAADDQRRAEEARRRLSKQYQDDLQARAASMPAAVPQLQSVDAPQAAPIEIAKPGVALNDRSVASPPSHSAASPPVPREKDATHQEYQQIHQRLKQLRTFMDTHVKSNPDLKNRMGDMRREIRKCVGQCTEGRGANRGLSQKIASLLLTAASDTSSPSIDVRQFVHSQNMPKTLPATSTFPGLLLYLLNILSKAVLAQFMSEASVSPRAADPVGILTVQIFSTPDLTWSGTSLIDILICKYHVLCPVLWGIYGPEATSAGKSRLGWWRDGPDGPWIPEQRHTERMTGLGAGFAAISLRNFAKSKHANPYPNYHYWQALQSIVSVRKEDAQPTHFVVLKAMVENNVWRILEFYGNAGKLALQKALVEFPNTGGEGARSVAARAVGTLKDVLRRDQNFTI